MPSIEYSPNSRACCKSCFRKIEAGQVRVGSRHQSPYQRGEFINHYFHAECYSGRTDFTKFWGWQNLSKEDQFRYLADKQRKALLAPVEAAPGKLGGMSTDIFGCRFHNGNAAVGDKLQLVREPDNQYDPNAIRVDNLSGETIGHIQKDAVAKLAQIMDTMSDAVQVDGTMAGFGNDFSKPLALEFWNKNTSIEAADESTALMNQIKASIGHYNFRPVKAPKGAALKKTNKPNFTKPKGLLLGSLSAEIVGCQYHFGRAGPGKIVQLVREPKNRFDSNAIRVDTVRGITMGHIKRECAAKLSTVMDGMNETLQLVGKIAAEGTAENVPVTIGLHHIKTEKMLSQDEIETAATEIESRLKFDFRPSTAVFKSRGAFVTPGKSSENAQTVVPIVNVYAKVVTTEKVQKSEH